ncbi:hypothetical protein NIES4072_61170 [Nostoc commune NIES-4072]|uniref:Uncharacterized protein n=1 Tax=Nostoc commune NIES-4072 TaxID=2005467 RepID=A0A2R5FWG5_NOSCO|nr:hypothetical protein [Nostoc commune]BBD66610.1 hypothetical protein NIES4070_29790 [Nostoc commune HK-02]GBG22409.1 hypothetical protein NIES4072_61170 [Nostoc commune NIES-4072]
MARIQITDLNPSQSELLLCELTAEEMLEINGGGWFKRIIGAALIVVGAFTTPVGIGAALIGAGGAIIASEEF